MQIKRKDIKPGLMINHLGTIYRIEKVKYRKVGAEGRTADTVKVLNPATGFIGEYDVNLILKHGKVA